MQQTERRQASPLRSKVIRDNKLPKKSKGTHQPSPLQCRFWAKDNWAQREREREEGGVGGRWGGGVNGGPEDWEWGRRRLVEELGTHQMASTAAAASSSPSPSHFSLILPCRSSIIKPSQHELPPLIITIIIIKKHIDQFMLVGYMQYFVIKAIQELRWRDKIIPN